MAKGLREIAESLDVAVSTVSRALSGKPGVSEALRVRILRMAEDQGLTPDPQAQALRSGKGAGLTLVVRQWESHIGARRNQYLLQAVKDLFAPLRIQMVTAGEGLDAALRQALTYRPAAILMPGMTGDISEATRRRLKEQGAILVGLDQVYPGFDAVVIDRIPGLAQGVRHLLASGCRYPVFMSTTDLQHPDIRLTAIKAAYSALGRHEADIRLHRMRPDEPLDYAKGYHETLRLLAEQPQVDGLFCFSDELAIGALRALAESGRAVPDQVRVIGFDDLPEAAFARVPLTTVAQPVDAMARAAVNLCRQRLKDPAGSPRLESFSTHLVVRASAPAIAGGG